MYKSYCLENEKIKVVISSLGGTILSFVDKSDNTDIVLGYKTAEEYLNNGIYCGAMVGRNANRIANAQFELNGKTYQLEKNDGPNNLHSGNDTFAFKEFQEGLYENNRLVLRYESKDGEGGFPGKLTFNCQYELGDNGLSICFFGISDQDTLFNVTNHSYFNLGDENILNHELLIPTNTMCLNDSNGMATDTEIDVTSTAFDFTSFKKIGDNFKLNHDNLAKGGIDHNYVFEDETVKLVTQLKTEKKVLSVYSDLPDMHRVLPPVYLPV